MTQNLANFFLAEDGRQLLFLRWAHQLQRGPFPLQRVLVQELDGAQSDGAGTAANLFFIGQVEEILPQFFFRDSVWGLAVVFGQTPYGAAVHLLRAL
jgi:hypothetical protein